MNFDINWSKEQLLNFLKGNGQNIKLGDVFFSNIIKEEIDGEVFSLLSKRQNVHCICFRIIHKGMDLHLLIQMTIQSHILVLTQQIQTVLV